MYRNVILIMLRKYSAVIQVKHLFLHSENSQNSILVCLNKIYSINSFRQFCSMYRNEILTLSELINIHVKGVVCKMRDIKQKKIAAVNVCCYGLDIDMCTV